MKNYFLILLLLTITISCKKKVNDKKDKVIHKTNTKYIVKQLKKADSDKNNNANWTHPDSFEFKNYKEYKITDTISIDLNGNGVLEKIYFDRKDCPKIIIKEKGQKLISFGCGNNDFKGFPKKIDWVDLWCVVFDKNVWEVTFKENGDIDNDITSRLERPSLYIGKKGAGGGIITYKNKNLYWIHQSD